MRQLWSVETFENALYENIQNRNLVQKQKGSTPPVWPQHRLELKQRTRMFLNIVM